MRRPPSISPEGEKSLVIIVSVVIIVTNASI